MDRLQIVNSGNQNLRVNPDTGTLAATDVRLDAPGASESIVGAAYTRNFNGGTGTTLFGIDAALRQLVRIGGDAGRPAPVESPNGGRVTALPPLEMVIESVQVGFNIQTTTAGERGFVSRRSCAESRFELFGIDLQTGATTWLGLIGDGRRSITEIAVDLPRGLNAFLYTDGQCKSRVNYLDEDGDVVSFTSTRGTFRIRDIGLIAGANDGAVLESLLLSDANDIVLGTNEFESSVIEVRVAKQAPGGKDLCRRQPFRSFHRRRRSWGNRKWIGSDLREELLRKLRGVRVE